MGMLMIKLMKQPHGRMSTEWFFHQIPKNCHFGVKKKIITHPDGFV